MFRPSAVCVSPLQSSRWSIMFPSWIIPRTSVAFTDLSGELRQMLQPHVVERLCGFMWAHTVILVGALMHLCMYCSVCVHAFVYLSGCGFRYLKDPQPQWLLALGLLCLSRASSGGNISKDKHLARSTVCPFEIMSSLLTAENTGCGCWGDLWETMPGAAAPLLTTPLIREHARTHKPST